ncbi:MAG: hypothetical protein ACFFDB_13365 [Promethearchaeota archaeon]
MSVPFLSVRITGSSTNYILAYGSNAYLYGGWIGFVSIGLSFIFFKIFKTKLAIIFGLVGCIFIGFNLIYILIFINLPSDPHQYIMEIGFYFGIISWVLFCTINIILSRVKFREKEEDISIIKKTILDLSTKFDRLEVHDISEKCGVDKNTIIQVLKNMTKKNEVYAEYFKTTNSVAFNQKANIEEIDSLMAKYKEWEDDRIDKLI